MIWLLIFAVALPVGAWLATSGGETPIAKGTGIAGSWKTMVQGGEHEARVSKLGPWPFAAIASVSGGMPEDLRQEARTVLLEPEALHLQFQEARYIRTSNHVGLWVVKGAGVLCMFRAVKIAAMCGRIGQAYRHGIFLELYKADKPGGPPVSFSVFGIAPNNVASVVARVGKQRQVIPVSHNTYWVEASRPIKVHFATH